MINTMQTKRNDLQGIRGLAILSVLGFHFYPHRFPNGYLGVDQWYLKQSNSITLLLIVILLVASGILICKDEIREVMRKQKTGGEEFKEVGEEKNVARKYPIRKYPRLDALTDDMTLDDAARMNAYWHQHDHMAAELQWPNCVSRSPEHNWCDFKENGTEFKIAMLGNSYVQNHHKMLIQECKHRAYSFAMDSETGCEPLASPHTTVDNGGMGVEWVQACAKKLDEFVAFIKDTKPDFAFILTRFTAIAEPFDIDENHLDTDKIYLEMKKQLGRLLPNIKRKLFMIDSFPRVNRSKLDSIVEELKRNKTMEEINKSLYNPSGFERGRRRLAELVKKECRSKCELINYVDAFWNKTMNAFQYFDARGFTYFTSGYHLSAHGIEHVRHLYRDICDNL
ncbi:hypothetical protein CAEBREN_19673 [Caenorhabditis brenneri]|uniref:SGNH domain-containing protein n=1 Tax=Caenorhabditis brenneri TaxID=135651 RepID=G0PJ69_CAEBE|nr:hypothetical protein CAEBREN_19673 [Caenorhabditis brenneri]